MTYNNALRLADVMQKPAPRILTEIDLVYRPGVAAIGITRYIVDMKGENSFELFLSGNRVSDCRGNFARFVLPGGVRSGS